MKKILAAFLAAAILFFVTAPALASNYLANTKSGKFHYYNCSTIKHHNAPHFVPYESRDACIADGYKPCKKCSP